jgi:ClpP class serine protease
MPGETIGSSRSPLFETIHSKRYQRQHLIRQIEEATGRRLAVYFANSDRDGSGIFQGDIAPFQDILSDCEANCDLDLLLQSPGGEIDSAEKLVYMIRERVRSLRIIVVERAKSAATLIALAADEILMSSTSELGPIDPQVTVFAADGRPLQRPARSFLDGLE